VYLIQIGWSPAADLEIRADWGNGFADHTTEEAPELTVAIV